MSDVTTALANAVAAIVAIGGIGTAAFGLVDGTKAFWGGVSNCGYGHISKALTPFQEALTAANTDWRDTIRANWINGVAKDDQKAVAKSLIPLGLSDGDVDKMAIAGHVDPIKLAEIVSNIRCGVALTAQDANLLGRFNASIDAVMDAGFERADQQYRNVCRLASGAVSVVLAIWAGAIISSVGLAPSFPKADGWDYLSSQNFWTAVLVGLIAVPIAPIAKDLASSLQAAVSAVQSVKT